jgi:hypothetical protein
MNNEKSMTNLNHSIYRLHKIFLIALLVIFSLPSMAQEDSKKDKKWNFTAAPYLLMPYMNGDVALGPIGVNVDASPGEIFDNLDAGLMLYFEASSDKWVVNFDLLYMNLGGKGETLLLERETAVDVRQLGLTFNGLYRVAEWASVGVGFRVNSIKQGLKIAAVPGPGPGEDDIFPAVDVSMTQTWVDPLIVARVMTRFNDTKWRLGLVADIGGFGIGSDLAWQINPFVGYQFSKLFEIDLAYRWLAMDYETGSGTDYFLYDMVISGPELGLLFHF